MVWATLGRLILVPLAFLVAACASMFVLLTLGYERIVHANAAGGTGFDDFTRVFDLVSEGLQLASALTVLPALALMIIGETARIRSLLFYVVGGGAALAAIPLLARFGQQTGSAAAAASALAIWQLFATAGFAGGLVYWLLAGRKA
jgi:hypothetical protein